MVDKTYTLEVVAADDGSEDQMLQFSEEFLAENDWRVDDVIRLALLIFCALTSGSPYTKPADSSLKSVDKSIKTVDSGKE